MDVGRTEGVHGPYRIENRPVQPSRPPEAAPAAPMDRADVSEASRLTSEALALPSLRADRVAELKRQIEAGSYQTDAKLLASLERFLKDEGLRRADG